MENEEKKEVIVKEVIKEVPRKRRMKLPNPIRLIIYVVIISLILGVSIFGISFGIGKIFKTQEKVLKLGLADVGELVTQTCRTVVLEDTRESRTFFDLFEIPFTESRQIFSYDFDVDAAIDFSKIKIVNIDDKKMEITIKIPHAEVYRTVILPDTFRSYLDSDGLVTDIDLTEHNDALLKMEEIAKNQCLAGNLLDNADLNAQRLLNAMIKSEEKYKNYDIIYKYYNGMIIDEDNEE